MRKQKTEPMEYTPSWDDGTYHTGSTRPQKEYRGLIAVLMILVTFLGGLASALGLLNIRLLQQMARQEAASDDVSLYLDVSAEEGRLAASDDDLTPSLPQQADLSLDLEEPAQESLPPEQILMINDDSIVSIHCTDPERESIACGVIIDEAGFLITNAYPISDCSHVYVTLSDGQVYRAALVGTDEFTDLAVLYIDAQDLSAAPFTGMEALQTGDGVVAMGPQREAWEGSIFSTSMEYAIGGEVIQLLKTDLQGVSGPIFNAFGQILGFTSPFLADEDGTMVIPSEAIRELAQQIIRNGSVAGRPCLGVDMEEVQPLHQQYWQLPQGLRVTRTFQDDSQLAGLEPGDILISLNGQPVTDRESLCSILRNLCSGDTVTAVVVRGNETITLTLTIRSSGERE